MLDAGDGGLDVTSLHGLYDLPMLPGVALLAGEMRGAPFRSGQHVPLVVEQRPEAKKPFSPRQGADGPMELNVEILVKRYVVGLRCLLHAKGDVVEPIQVRNLALRQHEPDGVSLQDRA